MVLHYQRKPFDLSLLHTLNIPNNRRGGTGSDNTLLLKGLTYKEGNLPLFTSLLEEVFSETEFPAYGVLGNSTCATPDSWRHYM
jgi:hypothetical protein